MRKQEKHSNTVKPQKGTCGNRPLHSVVMCFYLSIKRLFNNLCVVDKFDGNPIIHNFPDVGADGEITVNCIITPTSGPPCDDSLRNQNLNGGSVRITPYCVGAFIIEIDEYGLRFRWKPAKMLNDSFLSPFSVMGSDNPFNKPSKERQDDGNK